MYSLGIVSDKLELWMPIMFFTLLWVVMQWHGKLPPVDSIHKFISIMNSRGGNIIILAVGAIYFFRYSMYIFTDLLNMIKDKTISEDNSFALMAIQFVTTSAFGGAMGALLKTMTGESSTARVTDIIPPGKTTVSTITTKTPPETDSAPQPSSSQVTISSDTINKSINQDKADKKQVSPSVVLYDKKENN